MICRNVEKIHDNKKHRYSVADIEDFIENDDSLIDETIKRMSNLTTKIFNSINIENAKIKRLENFNFLHKHLSNTNELNISLDVKDVPMVYPYLINDEK